MAVGEITITIAIVCGLMLAVFLLVTFVEDKRRKMRKKSRREAEKVLAGQGDPMRKEKEKGEEETEFYAEEELYGEIELYGENELYEEEALYGEDNITEQETGAEREKRKKNPCEDGKPAGKESTADAKKAAGKESTADAQKAAGKEKTSREKPEAQKKLTEDIPEEVRQEKKETPIIRVNDVTMKFRIATGSTSGLKDFLIQKLKKQISTKELVALDHVSFDVFKGEVVGIIGTNGSGKSTLLKIVSGALKPSEGKVTVDRRKVQLLSLGVGFDTELSARENVYLNGAIIGYSREFIDRNYEKIVAFSELEGFMDEKVKNFSSGMVSRLAFSIATVGDAAEILILDEVLSVGDEFFRKKSLARVKEMIHGGSTVLMVSHGMGTILENCTKVVWIEKGKLQMVGDARTVCSAYKNQFG